MSIDFIGEGTFVKVPVDSIEIVDRPIPGEEHKKVFFNPRSKESLNGSKVEKIRDSIKETGLETTISVNAITDDSGKVTSVHLIAGECRLQSIKQLIENNEECYDETTDSYLPAKELYKHVHSHVHYNLNEEQCLAKSYSENQKRNDLTTSEEIEVVERLYKMGYDVAKISELLGEEKPWVSYTVRFRKELPEKAFDCLLSGKLKRNAAISLLSYSSEEREAAFEAGQEVKQAELEDAIGEIDEQIAQSEDLCDIANADLQEALDEGDNESIKEAKKEIKSQNRNIDKANDKKEKLKETSGNVKKHHIEKGAAQQGLISGKNTKLNKEEIKEFYVNKIDEILTDSDFSDPILNEQIPEYILIAIKETALSLMDNNRDVLTIARQVMVHSGIISEEDLKVMEVANSDFEDEEAFSGADADEF